VSIPIGKEAEIEDEHHLLLACQATAGVRQRRRQVAVLGWLAIQKLMALDEPF
jgi:hypothetical protein